MSFFNRKAGLGILAALFSVVALAQQTYTTMYPPVGGPYKYQTVTVGQSGSSYNPLLGSQAVLDADVPSLIEDGWTMGLAGGVNVSGTTTLSTGTTTARTLAARGADVINVADYGPFICNNSYDNSTTINAAAAVWVATTKTSHPGVLYFPNNGGNLCLVASPINFTGVTSGRQSTIEGNGVNIYCYVSGEACVDMTGSVGVTMRDVHITGNAGAALANFGLQVGNTGSQGCGQFIFDNLFIDGNWQQASYYNQGCETVTYLRPYISNAAPGFSATASATGNQLTVTGTPTGKLHVGTVISGTSVPAQTTITAFGTGTGGAGTYTLNNSTGFASTTVTAGTYAVIMDGNNHWGQKSTFVSITRSIDGNYSFNENFFLQPIFGNYAASNGHLLWVANAHRHEYIDSYGLMPSSTTPWVQLYDEGFNNWDLEFDFHMEVGATCNFQLTGSNATPTVKGLRYRDHYNQSTGAVVCLDGGITSATLRDFDVRIENLVNAPTLFDTASNYTVNGNMVVPLAAFWSTPANFSGGVCIAGVCDQYKNPGGSNTNTASGNGALSSLTAGSQFNTAYGFSALLYNSSGTGNTAVGYNVMPTAAMTGVDNIGIGSNAGYITSGGHNAFAGWHAMGQGSTGITGSGNSGFGDNTLTLCQGACATNTALGQNALDTTTTGTGNIGVGVGAVALTATTSNEFNIGGALMGYDVTSGISVTSGGGTSPSVSGTGTALFFVTEGTGTPTTTLVLTMPAAGTDWGCDAVDRNTATTQGHSSGAASTTSTTITFNTAPAAGDRIQIKCLMQ